MQFVEVLLYTVNSNLTWYLKSGEVRIATTCLNGLFLQIPALDLDLYPSRLLTQNACTHGVKEQPDGKADCTLGLRSPSPDHSAFRNGFGGSPKHPISSRYHLRLGSTGTDFTTPSFRLHPTTTGSPRIPVHSSFPTCNPHKCQHIP